MSDTVSLEESRKRIDEIDRELVRLYTERMKTAAAVAAYKKEHGLPVLDIGRERHLLARVADMAGEEMQDSAVALYGTVLSLSRAYQSSLLVDRGSAAKSIESALQKPTNFSPNARRSRVRASRARIRRSRRNGFSAIPRLCISRDLKGYFPPLKRGFAVTACFPLKTVPQAR